MLKRTAVGNDSCATYGAGAAGARTVNILRRALALAAMAVSVAGFAAPVALPQLKQETAAPPPGLEPPARGTPAIKRVALDAAPVAYYQAGNRNDWDIVVSPELAAAYAAHHRRDVDAVLDALQRYAGQNAGEMTRWVAATLRFDTLQQFGGAADAESVSEEVAALGQKLLGNDMLGRAMRGLARLELADYDAALADLGSVARAIGPWSLPTSYSGPPSNLFAVRALCDAQLRAYAGIASVHLLRRNYSAALIWGEAAEGLFNDLYYVLTHPFYGGKTVPESAADGRAYNLAILGAARSAVRRDPAAGAAELDEARRFFASIRHGHGLTVVAGLRAHIAQELGSLEEAERIARDSEQIAAAAGLGGMVWKLAAERGKALLLLKRAQEAEAAFRSAQNGIEQTSGSLASESAKLRFGTGKEEVTRQLVRFALERGDSSALFRDLERSRARAFIDMLGDRPVAGGRQADLAAAIRRIDRQTLRQRLLNGAPGGVSDGAARLASLAAERARRVAELRTRDPELADTLSVAVVELKDLQARLGAGEVLAYSIPAEPNERIKLLLVTRAEAKILEPGPTESALLRLLSDLDRAIQSLNFSRQKTIVAEMSRQLRVSTWGARTALYVVPSGSMHFVPWGALDVDHPVAVLPNGGWLLRTPISVRAAGAAAVVGDPDFRGAYAQLPGARQEAAEVGRLYRAEVLIGEGATEDALRKHVGGGVDVLHLATHGFFEADKPLDSSFVLSGPAKPVRVTAARIFAAPLPARLVVLSACETGLGKAVAGEDFLGLPRSFYLGGTLAVLSSLWPVDDAGTRAFMRVFHEKARTGDYGGAWLAARNALRDQGMPPFVYGAFVLGGAIKG